MEATGSICILPWDHWTHMRSWCSWCSCATLRSMPPDPNLRGINWGRLKPLSSSYGHPAHQAVPGLCPERKLPLPHILQCDDCHYSSKNGCTPKAQNSVTLGIHEYNPCFNMFQPSGCVCKCFFLRNLEKHFITMGWRLGLLIPSWNCHRNTLKNPGNYSIIISFTIWLFNIAMENHHF